ncbi:MAG: hypothetical protein M0R31_03400 [Candidatus Riflebacteria bacterium]|nr:hypothetical protein [Candidatus Riflebacteria bacterium]
MRGKLLNSIAETISDYREDEITVNSDHIEKWIQQFSDEAQTPILQEMDHALKKTYFSKKATKAFLEELFKNSDLVGEDPCAFWDRATILNIQSNGNSQKEMVLLLNKVINNNCNLHSASSKQSSFEEFIYLDDGLFTGNRILRDLDKWLTHTAPQNATVHVITIALHLGGYFYIKDKIEKLEAAINKGITIRFWRLLELEDRKTYINSSDVLRPCVIPDDQASKEYVDRMTYKPCLRYPGQAGNKAVFSSDEGRQLLEQEFLLAGVKIRQMCPYLNEYQRPLGNSVLETLGFGSLFVTFRNCPNNAPLALWAGDPWFPLFPRKTNSETSFAKYKAMLDKTFLLW